MSALKWCQTCTCNRHRPCTCAEECPEPSHRSRYAEPEPEEVEA